MRPIVWCPLALLVVACGGSEEPLTSSEPERTTATTNQAIPPSLDPLDVPDWPPFGPSSSLVTTCSGNAGVRNISAIFTNASWKTAGGTKYSTAFTGGELGEGQGRLRVRCCDVNSTCAERSIENFIVDLSPPEIAPERLVASPSGRDLDGDIAVWVSDAWVLGSVTLTFGGTTLHYDFPHAYPSTVGTEWDVSRVTFSAKDLPLGAGQATVIVSDAAGNTRATALDLRIDGTAPTVSFLEPGPGAVIRGPFVVRMSSEDESNPTPTNVDLWIGGAFVGRLAGPLAELTIDPSTLPPGATELRAIARDDAGNESTAAEVTVQIAP